MMVPIVEAVLGEIKNESLKNQLKQNNQDNSQINEVKRQSLTRVAVYFDILCPGRFPRVMYMLGLFERWITQRYPPDELLSSE